MNNQSKRDASIEEFFAYIAPFAVFLLLLGLVPPAAAFLPQSGSVWIQHPEFIIFPLQTLVCGILLFRIWPKIQFRGIAQAPAIFLIGIVVFAIWIAPQYLGWEPPRTNPKGFNPDLFASSPVEYWMTVAFRFIRLVVIVPLLEEIFWRGFLMRYLVSENFTAVPFGTFRWPAFLITAIGFCLEHQRPDYAAALITGLIFNGVACWTRSLGSCILVHAFTNLFLGLYIMNTKQWGYW